MAEDRREDREAKLMERAQQLASESYCSHQNHIRSLQGLPPISMQERILAALRQTAEEEREAAYSDWDLRANAAYAEGERAGREAEWEANPLTLLNKIREQPWDSITLRYDAGEWSVTLDEDCGQHIEGPPCESLVEAINAARARGSA